MEEQYCVKMSKIKGLPILGWDTFLHSLPASCFTKIQKTLLNFARKHRWYLSYFFSEEVLDAGTSVIILNRDLKVVSASENIEKLTGYTPEEIIGRSPEKLLHGEKSSSNTIDRMRQAVDMEVPFEAHVINYHKSGRTYFSNVKSYPVFDEKHELTHFVYFEKLAS